jgi:hypothetical protein
VNRSNRPPAKGGLRRFVIKRPLWRAQYIWLLGLVFGTVVAACSFAMPSKANAGAGINQQINYQGRLMDTSGNPVADGYYNIRFRIYKNGNGQVAGNTGGSPPGTLLWTEKWLVNNSQSVRVTNGYFSVQLGSVCALTGGTCQGNTNLGVDFNQNTLYLSLDIGGTANLAFPTWDGEMLPMERLTASPYTMNAGMLGGLTAAQFLQFAASTIQTDSSTTSGILLQKTGASGNILELQKAGADVLMINTAGQAVFRPQTDAQTALQVKNQAGTVTDFTVDTSNSRVGIGLNNPSTAVDAVGSINASTSLKIGGVDVCTASGCTPTSGSGNYIQNQVASPQTANFYIQSSSTSTATSTLQALASQTSDVLDLRDSSAGLVGGIETNGTIFSAPLGATPASTGVPSTARLFVQPLNSTSTAIIARAANSSPGDVIDLQDQTGSNNLFSVGANGNITIKPNATSVSAFQVQNTSSAGILTGDTSNIRVTVGTIADSVSTNDEQLFVGSPVPASATSAGTIDTGPNGLAIVGNYAYTVTWTSGNLNVIDITNPNAMFKIGSVSTADTNPIDVAAAGQYVYSISYASKFIDIYDVTKPSVPNEIGFASTQYTPHAITSQGQYLFVCEQNSSVGQLEIFDTAYTNTPTLIGTIASGTSCNNLFVSGNYAYLVGDNDLEVFDVSNPWAPVAKGTIATNTHPTAIYVQGRYAYVGSGTGSVSAQLQIFDVSNPSSIATTGTLTLGAAGTNPQNLVVQGRYAYIVDNATAKLQMVDVSNPASPTNIGTTSTNTGPWSIKVVGRYAYIVNSGSGNNGTTIQAFDVGSGYIQQLETGTIEVGTLNTGGNATFAGSLSVQGGLSAAQIQITASNVDTSGRIIFSDRNSTTSVFQVTDASGAPLLVADLSGTYPAIKVGGGDVNVNDSPVLLQLDNKTSSTDPSISNGEGAMYYNVALKSFRCYEAGTWRSCFGNTVFANTSVPTGNTIAANGGGAGTDVAFTSTYTIPANDCQAGRVYTVIAAGYYSAPTTASGPTLQLKLQTVGASTVTLASDTAQAPGTTATLTNRGWRLTANVICDSAGATASVDTQGMFYFVNDINTTSTGAGGDPLVNGTLGTSPTTQTIDGTTNQTLRLTANWSASNATSTITMRQFIVQESGP